MNDAPDVDVRARLVGFDQSPDMVLVTEGPDLVVTALNRAGVALVGDRPLGVPLREAFADLAGQQFYAVYEETYRTGEPQAGEAWRLRVEQPDGSSTQLHVSFVTRPWFDESGAVAGVVGRTTDVSATVGDRHRTEQQDVRMAGELAEARDLVITMQDALLPKHLPVLPATDIAARYLLAAEETAAGGDWFDAVVRPDGTVALVVGDVVGHGVAASAVMGQLRAVLHDHLSSGEPLAAALGALDRHAGRQPESRAATVCVAILDPRTGDVQYCTSGHPPPALVSSQRHTRFLPTSGARPLATRSTWPLAHARLEPGDLLVLYSDGLIERPGRTPQRSIDEIGQVLTDTAHDPALRQLSADRAAERLCQLSLELLTRITGYTDDITVLAAQRIEPFPAYAARLPATAANVRAVREGLGSWLAPLEVSPVDDLTVRHAVSELVTNVVDHAYWGAEDPGEAWVDAELEPAGDLRVSVRDEGRWLATGRVREYRGRGLGMVRALVDDLTVDVREDGTTATFRYRLTRPAQLLGSPPSGPTAPKSRDPGSFSVDVEPDAVSIRGAVDVATADQLRAVLHQESRGGTRDVTVDLAAVDHLGSAGVRVLHEIGGLDGATLSLRAPPGSVAEYVLELVRLPHSAGPEPG